MLSLAFVGAGCSGSADESLETVTAPEATATAPEVTVTADAVTSTAEAKTVTPRVVTITPPRVTKAAAEVTVTGAAPGSGGGAPGTALEALASLPVKGKAGTGGHDRDKFGSAWTDATSAQGSRNGCDTRNDVLRRDLENLVVEPGTGGCVAQTGTLDDPYSGDEMPFSREDGSSSDIDIDHMVSLSNAWQTGASQLSEAERAKLANDPLNLWAVDASLNSAKGDGDAATWLPPNRSRRCDMVARQVAVKDAYGLWVTSAEADAIERVLNTCPDEPLPTIDQLSVPQAG